MDMDGIPDDLLVLILMHVDSPIYLLRAASTCKRLYRVVAGSSFLDRFRSKHGPPVGYGYYNINQALGITSSRLHGFDSSYFRLDFLAGIGVMSTSSRLQLLDLRAGLVLLHHLRCQELVVCEPMSRRCVRILPAPSYNVGNTQAFLLDGDADGSIGISNFKVLCADHVGTQAAYIYTASGGGGSTSWREINVGSRRLLGFTESSVYFLFDYEGSANRRHAESGKPLLAVDRRTAELVWYSFPHVVDRPNLYYSVTLSRATVTTRRDGGGESIVVGHGDAMVFARRHGGSSSGETEWVLEKTIRLSAQTHGLPPFGDAWLLNQCPNPKSNPAFTSVHRAGTVNIVMLPQLSYWRLDLDSETVEPMDNPTRMMPYFQYPCELPWPPMLREY